MTDQHPSVAFEGIDDRMVPASMGPVSRNTRRGDEEKNGPISSAEPASRMRTDRSGRGAFFGQRRDTLRTQ